MLLYIALLSCLKILVLLHISMMSMAADALVVPVSASCDSQDKSLIFQHKSIHGNLSDENKNLIEIACLHDYSGTFRIENLRGLTLAEFKSHQITIFIAAHLKGDDFMLTFTHELAHAGQYSKWMKIALRGNSMAEKLNFIQSLIVSGGMNSSYQTLAK